MWTKASGGKSERGSWNETTGTVAQTGNPTKFTLGDVPSDREVNKTYMFSPDYVITTPRNGASLSIHISVDEDNITINSQNISVPMTKHDSTSYTIQNVVGNHIYWKKY